MFKHVTDDTAPEVLTEAQLALVSGGVTAVDGTGNMPICPPLPPVFHGVPFPVPQGPIK